MDEVCSYCGFSIPAWCSRCPHCARPSLFPNVTAAGQSEERHALGERYRAAVAEAGRRGSQRAVEDFERSVGLSRVVISRSLPEMLRLASSDRELYATFHQIVGAGIRLPNGNKWDRLRLLVDSALFPHYKDEIRFGSLSLDGNGISHFGPCAMTLRTDMLDYRVSLFEENSILFFEKSGTTIAEAVDVPKGYRSVWDDRARHAVAKLGTRISPATSVSEHRELLAQENPSPERADFIEAHVYGPMTIRTMEKVRVAGKLKRAERAMLPALREMFGAAAVPLEIA